MNFVRIIINLFQFNRTNWKAVILCLMAAAIFWLFNAFNKSHTSTISFPLHFDYNDQRYVAVKPLPHKISINVTGSGWDLIRKTFGVKIPALVIPLERPLETKKILTTSIVPLLSTQLGSLRINYISTDTLHIELDEKASKTFILRADLSKVKFKEGFGNIGVIDVEPDTVLIDGPHTIIASLPDTIVIPLIGSGISRTFHDEVEVPLFNSESINRNPPVVTVGVEVGQVETIEATFIVKVIHKPRSIKILADSVKAFIRIPVDQKEDFQTRIPEVSALMDLRHIDVNTRQLQPKIIGLPIYARVVSIDSLSYKID